jgi:hypothetical protein
MMDVILEMVRALSSPDSGVKVLLLICAVLSLIAYWREKARNERVSADRLREAREDTELLVETVNEAVGVVKEFKASNEALRVAFDALAVMVCDNGANRTDKRS